jgi:acyl-CoA synthetase (AMP-forming)/AMP-acid ligase II
MINLAELATKAAQRAPGAPALIDAQRDVARSFGALAHRVQLLARGLTDVLGLEPGARIAVLSRNCVELMELYLAAAKAEVLLFPLNWRLSEEQIGTELREFRPSVIFYEHKFSALINAMRSQVPVDHWIQWQPYWDSEYEEFLRRAGGEPASSRRPASTDKLHRPFLAVSTGGTTGVSKCAVHSQYSYGACSINYLAAARIKDDDVYMMLGQLFHVVGYMPLAYLARGRPVVITNFDARELVDVIREEKVTGFFGIATMLPRLIEAVKASGEPTHSVRQVEYGGAPMSEKVIREAATVFQADLIQAWGMSELGPGTYLGPAAHRLALSGERPELLRSCGQEALLSTVAVLDEEGRPVPQDGKTIGEICHRGPGNMIGYWNKPEETAAIMRDGWVHSGDGGAWDAEGYVFIRDRMKSMIISGGENVFPGEIERVLGNHPGVADVAVVGSPDAHWGEVVKAVVVRAESHNLTEGDVACFVETRLGAYKKPRIVEFVDELPTTPTGKVDRKALSTPVRT